jgi:hypothetical protein
MMLSMIDCPECAHSDRKGEVEYETFKMFSGVFEPVGYWVSCENCSGFGQIEKDDDDG